MLSLGSTLCSCFCFVFRTTFIGGCAINSLFYCDFSVVFAEFVLHGTVI